MVKAKVILLSLLCLCPLSLLAQEAGQGLDWSVAKMDASRTGVTVTFVDNVKESIGTVKGNVYTAPNGRVFKGGSVVKVASLVLAAQEKVSYVKEYVAYAPETMPKAYPESPLSNWFADNLMEAAAEATGKKVDVSIGNFGGIRIDMPKGMVTLDDIMSMFPFKNNVCYVALKGRDLRLILEDMAAKSFQVLGGVEIVAKDHKLVSVKIGGQSLRDDKTYGVATISFLLAGGDGLHVAKNAVEVIDCGVTIFDAIMAQIAKGPKQEDGYPVVMGTTDGRIKILRSSSF